MKAIWVLFALVFTSGMGMAYMPMPFPGTGGAGGSAGAAGSAPVVEAMSGAGGQKPPPQIIRVKFEGSMDKPMIDKALASLHSAAEQHPRFIVVEINSIGGNVEYGFAFARAIEDSNDRVVCLVDGSALSMAFYVLQSCNERVMTRRSVLMTHEVRLGTINAPQSTMSELYNYHADITAYSRAFGEHVSHRMGMTYRQYAPHVTGNKDWYMDWVQALRYRAIDNVVYDTRSFLAELGERE